MAASNAVRVPARLFQALRDGATALTSSQAAASRLRRAFDDAMLEEGRSFWAPATVLPLERWLGSQWHQRLVEGVATEPLLNAAQEQMLWRLSVAEHQRDAQPGELETLAGLAGGAWRLLWLMQGQHRLAECGSSSDGRAFLRWVRSFERRLAQSGAIASAQLPARVEDLAARRTVPFPPEPMFLVDCGTLEPAYRSLLQALRQAGCSFESLEVEVDSSASLETAADEDEELLACVDWLRTRLKELPTGRFAVIVPKLTDRRAEIERVFTAELTPPGFSGELPFAFARGDSLERSSVVTTALLLLRWRLGPLSLEEISTLLGSPHFAGQGREHLAMAEFDAFELRPRLRLRPELSLGQMITALEKSGRKPRLLNLLYRLRRLRDAEGDSAAEASVAGWIDAFRGWLTDAGYGPSADATAAELEAWQQWESALDEVATLDGVSSKESPGGAGEVLEALTGAVRARRAPAGPHSVAVEVSPPAELGGAAFDGLWVLSADDQSWPEPVRLQPLLPWRLQNDLGMPGADRELDLSAARRLTRRIVSSATEVVFSFARVSRDEAHRISPLVTELGLPARGGTRPAREQPPLTMEQFLDDVPIPHIPETVPVHGGARILELQAACGFRAFAELRLWSCGVETREPGMNARDRGVVVHKVMEEFWRRVVDQSALRQLDQPGRKKMLDECIAIGMRRAEDTVESSWDAAYLEVQRERLHALLGPWLDVEASRPSFAVLQQETALKNVSVGSLTIAKLQADRIDETEGGLLLIDYKTGKAEPAAWRSNRPDQPQLPLYATVLNAQKLHAEPLSGVAFAQLRAGDTKLNGIADDPRVLRRSAAMDEGSFAEQLARWEQIVTELAGDFRASDARVDPKCYPETCAYCNQSLFCRVDASTLQVSEGEEELEEALDG